MSSFTRIALFVLLIPVFLLNACNGTDEDGTRGCVSCDSDRECWNWKFVTDEKCRSMILQGCNFDGSAKGDSGLPNFGREHVLNLSRVWGFNFARYLIFWFKIEPEPGIYDEAYLDEVEERLDWMHEAGILVVLDMHQDVWGPGISDEWEGSDGAPEWATITDGRPHIPFSRLLGGWAFDYLSPAVMQAFDNFWDFEGPHPELQSHYAAMWAHVAERFRDHPAVLGYNPMNEPWQGTGLLRYREFDEGKYTDFNQRMIDAIRDVDTENWVFFEPCAFVANQGLPSYLGILEDPRPGPPRLAYFPHLYPVTLELGGGYDPETDPTLNLWAGNRRAEHERQHVPLVVGEWSMLNWYGLEDRVRFFDDVLRLFEQLTSGWAYWDYNFFVNEPFPEVIHPMVTRPYPQRIAGTPLSRSYDESTGRLEVIFRQDDNVSGPTEIYLGAGRNYPDGWNLEVSDTDGAWSYDWNEITSILRVWTDPAQLEHTIRVFPDTAR